MENISNLEANDLEIWRKLVDIIGIEDPVKYFKCLPKMPQMAIDKLNSLIFEKADFEEACYFTGELPRFIELSKQWNINFTPAPAAPVVNNKINFQLKMEEKVEEKPHVDCPNYLDEFTLAQRAVNCVTCEMLGTNCRGLKHPRPPPDSQSVINNVKSNEILVSVPDKSASAIANKNREIYDLYSQICFPGTYIPNARLREMINNDVESSLVESLCSNLRSVWQLPDTFRSIKNGSETAVNDGVLQLLLQKSIDCIIDGPRNISVLKFNPDYNYLAKSCNPEHSLVHIRGGSLRFILLGTEAKGFEASCRECYSQLISIGGSSAMRLFEVGLILEQSVVPVIAFTGNSIQFGAVYLMDCYFPVLVILSECLNPIGSLHTQHEIATWLIKLVRFSETTATILQHHSISRRENFKKMAVLSCAYFFKPVRSNTKGCLSFPISSCSRRNSSLNHIMRMYEMVSKIESADSMILFPVGTLAVPGAEEQCNKQVRDFMIPVCNNFGIGTEDVDFCPIIVFP
eukprot:gene17574-24398_t